MVFDVLYDPWPTPLAAAAAERAGRTVRQRPRPAGAPGGAPGGADDRPPGAPLERDARGRPPGARGARPSAGHRSARSRVDGRQPGRGCGWPRRGCWPPWWAASGAVLPRVIARLPEPEPDPLEPAGRRGATSPARSTSPRSCTPTWPPSRAWAGSCAVACAVLAGADRRPDRLVAGAAVPGLPRAGRGRPRARGLAHALPADPADRAVVRRGRRARPARPPLLTQDWLALRSSAIGWVGCFGGVLRAAGSSSPRGHGLRRRPAAGLLGMALGLARDGPAGARACSPASCSSPSAAIVLARAGLPPPAHPVRAVPARGRLPRRVFPSAADRLRLRSRGDLARSSVVDSLEVPTGRVKDLRTCCVGSLRASPTARPWSPSSRVCPPMSR